MSNGLIVFILSVLISSAISNTMRMIAILSSAILGWVQ